MSNYLRTRDNLFDGNFLNDFFGDSMFRDNKHLMRTDIIENEKDIQIEIEMPGFEKENIKMTLENDYLKVEAFTNTDTENKKHYLRRERFVGSMERTYYVGENVSEEDITASFKHGVLTINIAKVEKKEPEKKYINIQ